MSFRYVTSVVRILPKAVVGVDDQLALPSVSKELDASSTKARLAFFIRRAAQERPVSRRRSGSEAQ